MTTPDGMPEMDAETRASLLKALAALEKSGKSMADPMYGQRRVRFLTFLLGSCLFLIPWIVFLGVTLPPHYQTGHWGLAWIGFDIALLGSLSATAWAVWRKRQIAIVCALISGTLLVCDAWFDVLFSRAGTDLWVSIATAVFAELPLAALMFFVAWRMLSFTVQIVWLQFRLAGPVPPLRRIGLLSMTVSREED